MLAIVFALDLIMRFYDDENGNRMEDSQFKMSWNN